MEGKLNEDGEFQIKRANGWTPALCPFTEGSPCGAWCAHFTEPHQQYNKKFERAELVVHLCQGKHWKFSEFEDRRELAGA